MTSVITKVEEEKGQVQASMLYQCLKKTEKETIDGMMPTTLAKYNKSI